MEIPRMRTDGSIKALREMCDYLLDTDPSLAESTLIEIGTFYGDSAIVFSEYFRNVVTIDPFDSSVGGIAAIIDMQELYRRTNQRLADYDNITLLRGLSIDIAKRYVNNSVNIVYIDGLHTYEGVKSDTDAWLPKLKKNGWLCGHDYRPTKFPGVVQAIDEVRKPDKVFRDYSFVIRLGGGK